MTIGWPLLFRLFRFPSGTSSLWHGGDVANRKSVNHHKMVTYPGRCRRSTANLSRNYIKVQRRWTFDVREVMTKVIGVRIEPGFDFFGSVFRTQFSRGVERNIHFAVVQPQNTGR